MRPTISKYWEELIDSANTVKELTNLQLQLQNYKVLDPACGSGNFLYVAYQELKRIEQLYNAFFHEPSSKLYQLHQQLDQLVMKAYNFDENEDILEQLLTLNLAIFDPEN